MSFLAELRRRNVIRMAGLYLVGAWLVVQVAATLLPVFDAPAWVMKALVGLLVIGFFVAIVVAWVFELTPEGFGSNHSGGVLGGMSTGQDLRVSMAIKPTSSILVPRASVNLADEPVEVITKGRHDPCVGIRATPILEALLALVVMDHALRQRAQCGRL